jgi:hypothetical protein
MRVTEHIGKPRGACLDELKRERRCVYSNVPFVWVCMPLHFILPFVLLSFCSHAMVLLAAKFDVGTGKWRLLVQSFWKGKQFFVIDEDYFFGCCATVYFVHTPQPGTEAERIKANRSAAGWVEADGGDSPDSEGAE